MGIFNSDIKELELIRHQCKDIQVDALNDTCAIMFDLTRGDAVRIMRDAIGTVNICDDNSPGIASKLIEMIIPKYKNHLIVKYNVIKSKHSVIEHVPSSNFSGWAVSRKTYGRTGIIHIYMDLPTSIKLVAKVWLCEMSDPLAKWFKDHRTQAHKDYKQ